MNKRYYLQLDLNINQHMLFSINERTEETYKMIGYLYLEDLKRSGTQKDFAFLPPSMLEDWDDFRNLITAKIITFEELLADEKEELLFIASTMIEFKPAVNHKVEFYVLKELLSLYENSWEKVVDDIVIQNCIPIYQLLISKFGVNSVGLETLTIDSLNYLSQTD